MSPIMAAIRRGHFLCGPCAKHCAGRTLQPSICLTTPGGGVGVPVILPLYSDSARPRTLPKANGVGSGAVKF